MTTTLKWRYEPKETKETVLSDEMKECLGKFLQGENYRTELPCAWLTLSKNVIPFLKSLFYAGDDKLSKESGGLIDIIEEAYEKEDRIQIRLFHD
jgi:hypothetical protein